MIMIWLIWGCSDFALHSTEKTQSNFPYINVSPDHYNYGEIAPQSSTSTTFTIHNEGSAGLFINDIRLLDGSAFSFFFPQEPRTIPPGESHQFDVIYLASGDLENAFLRIESNDPSHPQIDVPLYGSTPSAALVLSPNPLDFGYIPVDTSAEDRVFIQNIGAIESAIQNFYLAESNFSIPEIPIPFTLAPGEVYELPVQFLPTAETLYEEQLWVQSDIGSHMTILKGTAEEVLIEEDPCLDPDLSYNQHPEATLRVKNGLLPVYATYLFTGAGYTNELWLQSPHLIHIATGHQTPEDTVIDLGTFATNQELFFKMYVRDTGHHYYSGPAHRNPDNFIHAAVSYLGDCEWLVGFEDMYNGGDQDFDDILMVLSGDLQMLP